MHIAVDVMKSEAVSCFAFFMLQLFFFHMSSFSLMWMLYSSRVAIIVNAVLAVFLVLFLMNGYKIWSQLYVSEADAVSGQFQDFAGTY